MNHSAGGMGRYSDPWWLQAGHGPEYRPMPPSRLRRPGTPAGNVCNPSRVAAHLRAWFPGCAARPRAVFWNRVAVRGRVAPRHKSAAGQHAETVPHLTQRQRRCLTEPRVAQRTLGYETNHAPSNPARVSYPAADQSPNKETLPNGRRTGQVHWSRPKDTPVATDGQRVSTPPGA